MAPARVAGPPAGTANTTSAGNQISVTEGSSALTQGYHIMLKPRGPICDLDCSYCYYLSKERLYPGSDFRMSEEVLEAVTRQYLTTQPVPEVVFGWQGGEPTLMGIEFFNRALQLQRKHAPAGTRVLNTIQTNGMHLNDEWCRFFKRNNFLVGISIDGPAQMHDAYRKDKGGHASHERVMAGLRQLQRHEVEYNVLTTVHAANVMRPLELYRFVRDEIGAQFVQFIPIVERDNDTGFQEGDRATERSVTGNLYGQFLIAVFDEWVHRDVGKVFVQMFDVALAAWVGQRSGLCVYAETCGLALALEHNGDLYSCDHYVQPSHLLGNVLEQPLIELVASPTQDQFGTAKRADLPRYCGACEVRFACNGGCPKNRFISTPDDEPGLNYLCAGYKAFFNHIGPAMRYMTAELRAERPPASIMEEFAGRMYPLRGR